MHLEAAALHLHHHIHGPKVDYIGVGLAAFVSWFGFFGPGEAVLVAAAVAASHGRVDITGLIATAWLGAEIGGVAGWIVGRYGGRRVLLAGRWLRVARERALENGQHFFERYGLVAVYFAPSWAAGTSGMRARTFALANAVCALAWALFIGLGAYLLGPSIRDISGDVGLFGTVTIVVSIIGSALLTRLGVLRRIAGRRRQS